MFRHVQKDARHFDTNGGAADAVQPGVDRLFDDVNGKPSDATRDAQPPVTDNWLAGRTVPFAGDGHGEPIDAVPQPYDKRLRGMPGTVVPDPMLNFAEAENDMLPTPGTFSAPKPGVVRMGDGMAVFTPVSVFKRLGASFSNIVFGKETK